MYIYYYYIYNIYIIYIINTNLTRFDIFITVNCQLSNIL